MTTTPTASPELLDLDRVHLLHSEEQDILLMANHHARGEDDGNYDFEAGGLLALIARAIAQYGHLARRAKPEGEAPQAAPFQQSVQPWMMVCFGAEISADKVERNDRFTEESLELVQACGMTKDRVLALVDYVYDRPLGEPAQEVGGVMVTLAALCLAQGLDMHEAAEVELARIWTKVEAIRAKQLTKPRGSPLPIPAATLSPLCGAQHAESCKEDGLTIGEAFKAVGGWMNGGELGYPSFGSMNALLVYTKKMVHAALAAQQAAAPGAVHITPQEAAAAGIECGDTECGGCNAGEPWCIHSAPGTPEAPKPTFPISDYEMAALRRFWECATDGEGYDVEKSMMQRLAEMGLVQRKSGAYYMSTEFGLYVLGEYTMDRAAAPKGGA